MKIAVNRLIFPVAGIWFYFAAVFFFFRKGLWFGGCIFVVVGTYFLWLARRRRP